MGTWTSALRLGSTSSVYPGSALENVRRLSGLVQDILWLLPGAPPGPPVVAELARAAEDYGHSYTVHLPPDLALTAQDDAARQASVEAARRAVAAVRPVAPWAYVVHLDGPSDAGVEAWQERAASSLEALAAEVGDPALLALENRPGYPLGSLLPLLERLPVSLCLGVGHLLRRGREPLPLLRAHLGRTRAIHLHAEEGDRDHLPLAAMDQGVLLQIVRLLRREAYAGVVTIDLSGAEAFFESWDLVAALWRRVQREEAEGL